MSSLMCSLQSLGLDRMKLITTFKVDAGKVLTQFYPMNEADSDQIAQAGLSVFGLPDRETHFCNKRSYFLCKFSSLIVYR